MLFMVVVMLELLDRDEMGWGGVTNSGTPIQVGIAKQHMDVLTDSVIDMRIMK